jgi:hypothetical protein
MVLLGESDLCHHPGLIRPIRLGEITVAEVDAKFASLVMRSGRAAESDWVEGEPGKLAGSCVAQL